jgi:phosphoglycerate dehydrogenase-like enzyme
VLLGLARGIVEESNNRRSAGPWQRTVGADLHGSRLGLLGLGDRTRGLLGTPGLALLKPTAYLINTSRAAVVDQDAFDTEPLPGGHPMRTAPRLPATPHLGYVSQANYRTCYDQAVENIRAFLAASPVRQLP